MKYLIINGSPHKGNTWQLVLVAKERVILNDKDAEFTEIHLSQLNLPFCLGCSNCFRKGNEYCPHSKIMLPIIDAIDKADGLIIATSCFNVGMTSLLKNFFDHICYMLHRPCFFTKKALVIVTTGGVGAGKAAKQVSANLMGIGFNRCYRCACTTLSWNNFKADEKTLKKANKITDKFAKDVKSKKLHNVQTTLLIPYNIFRGMSLYYVKGSEYPTADGDFWTAPERSHTLYDSRVPVPFYKKPVGLFFNFIGKTMGGKLKVTYKK